MGAAAGSSKPGEQWRGSGEGQPTRASLDGDGGGDTKNAASEVRGKVLLPLFGAFLPMRLQTGMAMHQNQGLSRTEEGSGQSGLHKSHGARGL